MSTSSNSNASVQQMFEQAAHLFQSALEAGIKMQEETNKTLTGIVSGMGSPQPWQEQTQRFLQKTMDMVQQNSSDAIRAINENTRTGLELLGRAFDARQANGDLASPRVKEMWETAIGSLRKNSELLVQINSRVLDSWRELVQIWSNGANRDPQ